MDSSRKVMFGPLSFPQPDPKAELNSYDFEENLPTKCLLCENEFNILDEQNDFLTHLFTTHHLVIADVPLIASFKSYINYWRIRLTSNPIQEFCTTLVDSQNENEKKEYFLLSDVLLEDKLLRDGLQKKRLEWVLSKQTKEREDNNFSKGCLFCKVNIQGTRAEYINHLSSQHNLQLGRPENLVFIDELLKKLESKMNSLHCLYCEKLFKDRNVLKEHMRKKLHKRIDPENRSYDKFYIINYLEMGKNWQTIEKEQDEEPLKSSSSSSKQDNVHFEDDDDDDDNENQHIHNKYGADADDESEWNDWLEEDDLATVICLFCEKSCNDFNDSLIHMNRFHGFDFIETCQTFNLNFYQQVKMVNYIRRQMHFNHCPYCESSFTKRPDLLNHMEIENHCLTPQRHLWDHPEYFFPTYENDNFLCHLDDPGNDDDDDGDVEQILNRVSLMENCVVKDS